MHVQARGDKIMEKRGTKRELVFVFYNNERRRHLNPRKRAANSVNLTRVDQRKGIRLSTTHRGRSFVECRSSTANLISLRVLHLVLYFAHFKSLVLCHTTMPSTANHMN